jgi:hypothetical protein
MAALALRMSGILAMAVLNHGTMGRQCGLRKFRMGDDITATTGISMTILMN